ncbi:MAG TPA: ABC transporter ATP-binding protein [Ktedonobacteraceae bacterium]|nr:ABC transporter ATP-binding protein [Ktedonobacteraceae bacterium]
MLTATLNTHLGAFHLTTELAAESGKTTVLLGESGSGKSTILRLLAGLLDLEDGRIVVDGITYADSEKRLLVPAQERPFGYVFQDYVLFPHLSIFENVAFGLRAQRIARPIVRARVEQALEQVQLAGLASRRPGQISGGQQQRVALARALVLQPRLLLLDEPLSALDIQTKRETRQELRRILAQAGITTVLVTHDYLDALLFGHHIVVLDHGQVIQHGSQQDLMERPHSSYVAELVGLNFLRGRVVRYETDALCALAFGDGQSGQGVELEATLEDTQSTTGKPQMGEEASVVVDPRSVTLHHNPPDGSARNLLRGEIVQVIPVVSGAQGHMRVTLRVDALPHLFTAEVTSASVTHMGLQEGILIYATFKAVEARIYAG